MARSPIHPGEILGAELAELSISAAGLARQIAVPPNRIRQILSGKRSISADTALRLGHWFGTSAQFWLNLQASCDLRLADAAAGSEIRALPKRPGLPSQVDAGVPNPATLHTADGPIGGQTS